MHSILKTSQHMRASISTYSGVEFFPLAPRFEDIWVDDLAHALANTCRYNGHTPKFYSVAQHSVLVSEFLVTMRSSGEGCPMDGGADWFTLAQWGLLHDASEAYISDICAPIKPFIQGYKTIETQLQVAVAQRFNLAWPMPGEVDYADKAVFKSELDSGIMAPVDWWRLHEEHPSAGLKIDARSPKVAERMFLERFIELFGRDYYDAHARPRS